MNFVNFILNKEEASADGSEIGLFRLHANDLSGKMPGESFAGVFCFETDFVLHLIIDESITDDQRFAIFMERVILMMGRRNYHSILQRKPVFISFSKSGNKIASRVIFKLRSYSSNTYIINIRYDAAGRFVSSLNVSLEISEENRILHFRKYISDMGRQRTLFDYNLNYFVLTESPVRLATFNDVLLSELKQIPDIIHLLKDSSEGTSQDKEIIDAMKNENLALLNAVAFLKKEVKHQFNERENVHAASARFENEARIDLERRANEIQLRYDAEYERLPGLYKKFGTFLKVISGKKQVGYYLSKRQKSDFIKLLDQLPKDKQISTWYYYEYEILPGWYKKMAHMIWKGRK